MATTAKTCNCMGPPGRCPCIMAARGDIDYPPPGGRLLSHLMGWECPRCHTVHAPMVQGCGCSGEA